MIVVEGRSKTGGGTGNFHPVQGRKQKKDLSQFISPREEQVHRSLNFIVIQNPSKEAQFTCLLDRKPGPEHPVSESDKWKKKPKRREEKDTRLAACDRYLHDASTAPQALVPSIRTPGSTCRHIREKGLGSLT